MAKTTKLAFYLRDNKIYEKEYTFDFYPGFSSTQKQKNIESFHSALKFDGINEVLEISRKSSNPIGSKLSAFNLMIEIFGNKYPIECVYQSSKVFNGKTFHELLNVEPTVAKKTVKEAVEKEKLVLTSFECLGYKFPLYPYSLFYDYIYVVALKQNPDIAKEVLEYNCFTDIEFNHKKQFASQARSCAIFKYLSINNLLDSYLKDINSFVNIYKEIIVSDVKQIGFNLY